MAAMHVQGGTRARRGACSPRSLRCTHSSSRCGCGIAERYMTPPFSLRVRTMFGGVLFRRMPKPSSSRSMMRLCVMGLDASSTIRITSHVRAVEMTCLPRPLPSLAPSIMPGMSSSWMRAPR